MIPLVPQSPTSLVIGLLLIAGVILSICFRKLTPLAAWTGGIIGWIIYCGAGVTGFLLLVTFFVLGTLATSWHRKEKNDFDSEGAAAEMRKPGQVLANGGAAAMLALMALFYERGLPQLMIAATFASATADTFSSELGVIYGRRFYNCLTWRRDTRGLDGVVSLEGTLIGIAGASVIAVIYSAGAGWSRDFFVIVLAGAIGNFVDSILGATLERKKLLRNDGVNFLSTVAAALVAGLTKMFLI